MAEDKKGTDLVKHESETEVVPAQPRPLVGRIFDRLGEKADQALMEQQTITEERRTALAKARAERERAEGYGRNIQTQIDADKANLDAQRTEAEIRAKEAEQRAERLLDEHEQRKAKLRASTTDAEADELQAKLRKLDLQRQLDEAENQPKVSPEKKRARLVELLAVNKEELLEVVEDEAKLLGSTEQTVLKRQILEEQRDLLETRRVELQAKLDELDGI